MTGAQKKLFGTNGVRGIVGKDMTPGLVLRIGMALGAMRTGCIGVGRDTRTSGPALASAMKAGLMASGCDVVDCGILPTPALQYLVREEFDAGAMITASHNPGEWNGVKVIEPDGTEMGDAETIELEERLTRDAFALASWSAVGRETAMPSGADRYVDTVCRTFSPDTGSGMTVVVDPGSGAAAATTPAILSRVGCRVFTINGQMDGRFPGRKPEPSVKGLEGLSELVRGTGAAFGVAHDGDADRAVFVDESGNFVGENQEFAIITDHVCRNRKGVVVTPVSSSNLIRDIALRNGCTVEYTPVGSIYVARKMRDLIAAGIPVAFGGEGNGGLIYPDHQFCRDGGMTAAMMVSILGHAEKPLSALAAALPRYTMINRKLKVDDAPGLIATLEQAFAGDAVDRRDGIRIDRESTWALVRPSGTEPFVRLTVESDQDQKAREFDDELMTCIRQFIKEIL
jgi:phosphomannomutase/phosphoglucomutase